KGRFLPLRMASGESFIRILLLFLFWKCTIDLCTINFDQIQAAGVERLEGLRRATPSGQIGGLATSSRERVRVDIPSSSHRSAGIVVVELDKPLKHSHETLAILFPQRFKNPALTSADAGLGASQYTAPLLCDP